MCNGAQSHSCFERIRSRKHIKNSDSLSTRLFWFNIRMKRDLNFALFLVEGSHTSYSFLVTHNLGLVSCNIICINIFVIQLKINHNHQYNMKYIIIYLYYYLLRKIWYNIGNSDLLTHSAFKWRLLIFGLDCLKILLTLWTY